MQANLCNLNLSLPLYRILHPKIHELHYTKLEINRNHEVSSNCTCAFSFQNITHQFIQLTTVFSIILLSLMLLIFLQYWDMFYQIPIYGLLHFDSAFLIALKQVLVYNYSYIYIKYGWNSIFLHFLLPDINGSFAFCIHRIYQTSGVFRLGDTADMSPPHPLT